MGQIHCAKSETVLALVLVYPNSLVIHMSVVSQNVFRTMTALESRLVSKTNAKIHVLEFVELTPSAEFITITLRALVMMDSLVILWLYATLYLKNLVRKYIFRYLQNR